MLHGTSGQCQSNDQHNLITQHGDETMEIECDNRNKEKIKGKVLTKPIFWPSLPTVLLCVVHVDPVHESGIDLRSASMQSHVNQSPLKDARDRRQEHCSSAFTASVPHSKIPTKNSDGDDTHDREDRKQTPCMRRAIVQSAHTKTV